MKPIRFGIALITAVPEMLRTAMLAERLGYDSMWMPDETVGYEMEYTPRAVIPDVFGCLTAMAMKTSKILMGTSVVDALIRPPVKTAQTTATLDSVSNGRLLVGMGGGEAGNHESFGLPTNHPYTRLRETIEIVRLLWESGHSHRVNYQGRHYSLKEAYLRIRPAQPRGPPIYIAAFGPKMLSLVGELADGWIPFAHTPETYKHRLHKSIGQSLARHGRSLADIDAACMVPMALSRDGSKARRAAIRVAKTYLVWSTDNMRSLLPKLPHPGIRQTQLKTLGYLKRLVSLSERIPNRVAFDLTVSGTADDCRDQIGRFIEAGCRHLIFVPTTSDEKKRAAMLRQMRKVISRL